LFEIRLPRWIANLGRVGGGEQSLSREFLTGMLATLLATPCSAPFLGTALGFALSQGALQIFLIFTAVGLGLALPYMLVAVWPQSVHALPKPGRWMITLRRVLAVFLLLTAIWLGAIVAAQKTNWLDMPVGGATSKTDLPWQYFDPNKIGQYVATGKIVFVDVTADWCLTCKLNERVVINSTKIRELLTAPDVVLMRADWTRPDAVISAYLASFGRYGIPFNAVYSKSNPTGLPLPELLSESAVESAMVASGK
jgi:suppressor for copper-sensitivity B